VRKSASFSGKQAAKDWAARHEYLITSTQIEASSVPFSDVLKRYVRDVSSKKRGEVWEGRRIKAFLAEPFASKKMRDLRPSDFAEYRDRAARAEAELANFRTRVERDRQANREAVIAEVIRSLLPVMDDLDRAETHGDLAGTPLELVAQKLRANFERYGVTTVGAVGEAFDPSLHEAVVRLPDPKATSETVAEVFEGGYQMGDRLVRPAKVAVTVPAGE